MVDLRLVTALVLVTAAPGAAPAQTGSPAPEAATPRATEVFTYRSEGRRDPFVSLLARGRDVTAGTRRDVEGPGGLAVADLSVRGVIQTPTGFVAMVQGPNSRTYLVRPNQRLLDGTITAITAHGLVIVQQVNDPLSPVKTREVRKGLRSTEEGT
jgi:Tfp pilus assembly protein PilP